VGFGKTVIADAVASDLAAEGEDLENSEELPSTAFFHVDASHLTPVHPDEIFRQLSLQLLYAQNLISSNSYCEQCP
jgi:hypothetical protein